MERIGKIRVLDAETVKKIAAGEIIKSPIDVVKELVENSIDSGATSIKVIVLDGGKRLIRVEDNGYGISKEDLKLTVLRHATSKFTSLENINFLGFRGEALFTIDFCSKLTIISKTKDSKIAYKLENNDVTPDLMNDGTVVICRDLFYNLPARLKFLKSNDHEIRNITNFMEALSIFYTNIDFYLETDKKIRIFSGSNRFGQILNIEEFNIHKIEEEEGNYRIKAQIYLPENDMITKSFLFVNGRFVKDKRIYSIMKNWYNQQTGKNNFNYFLDLYCPYEEVDVNVHPSKLEVKFQKETPYNLLYKIINRFNNLKPQNHPILIDTQTPKNHSNETLYNNVFTDNQTGKSFQIEKPLKINQDANISKEDNFCPLIYFDKCKFHDPEFKFDIKEDIIQHNFNKNLLGTAIGQLFNRYIICLSDNELIIVDQHAAAERIMMDRINKEVYLQELLEPIIINTACNIDLIDKNKHNLDKIIRYEVLNDKVIVFAIPDFLTDTEIINIFQDLELDENLDFNNFINHFFHNYSCKNSIKSGQKLTIEEMQRLLNQLENTKMGDICNHGRKTYIKFNISKLDNLFSR